MKGIKTLVSATAIAVCLGAASMANAATIVSSNSDGSFSATGSITVKSPSSFQAPVTCPVTASGTVSGGVATITSFSTTAGGGLCALPNFKNLPSPGWVITASTTTTGTISNVGYTITSIPSTNCGPSTINVAWAPAAAPATSGGVLSTPSAQALSGSCTVTTLSVSAPAISITP
ncbi:alkane oxidation protein activator PraB [Pseudomonas gingeri]|uniref:alkane oxidation protein activator PraB n=1 Tax=Pseudomonas TaxID=286 RepID=UPI001BEDEE82|nr:MULTISPECIES: alkane oxidation protein activator PraB [Pseudomonas]BBP76918.1 protein activator [Pseudomonas sp. Ost2]